MNWERARLRRQRRRMLQVKQARKASQQNRIRPRESEGTLCVCTLVTLAATANLRHSIGDRFAQLTT